MTETATAVASSHFSVASDDRDNNHCYNRCEDPLMRELEQSGREGSGRLSRCRRFYLDAVCPRASLIASTSGASSGFTFDGK